jgi:hypothetical protein
MKEPQESVDPWQRIHKELSEPFEFKVKPQTRPRQGRDGKFYAMAVGFISREQVQDRLDEVVGAGNWECHFTLIDDKAKAVECALSIRAIPSFEFVTKRDVGGPEHGDSETNLWKGAYSDSFKRAFTMFGGGRFLYKMPVQWMECTARDTGKVDNKGQKVWQFIDWVDDPINKLVNGAKFDPPELIEQAPPAAPPVPVAPTVPVPAPVPQQPIQVQTPTPPPAPGGPYVCDRCHQYSTEIRTSGARSKRPGAQYVKCNTPGCEGGAGTFCYYVADADKYNQPQQQAAPTAEPANDLPF